MLRIIRVDIVDGQTLDIELSNGHLILFDTHTLLGAGGAYASMGELEVLPRPQTDGQSVFWPKGPRLELGEIMARLTQQESADA